MELNYLGKGDIEYEPQDEWMLDGYPIPAPVRRTGGGAIILSDPAPIRTGSRAYLYALPANGRKWLCAEVLVEARDALVPARTLRGPERGSADDEYWAMLRMIPATGAEGANR